MRLRAVVVLASGAMLLLGCHHVLRPTSPLNATPPPLPPAEPSSVMLPIAISLETVRWEADQAIPRRWAEWDAWIRGERWCAKYKVERRGVALSLSGSSLRLSAPGHLWLQGCASPNNHACTPCVGCDAEVALSVSAELALSPKWRLEAAVRRDDVRIGPCHVTVAEIDIHRYVERIANKRIDEALGRISNRLRAVGDFREKGETLWSWAHRPLPIANDAWILLNPDHVTVSPITQAGDTVGLTVGFVARPRIVSGAVPPSTQPLRPLPDLQQAPPSDRFRIVVDGHLDYKTATAHLSRELVGRRFSFVVKHKMFWFFGPVCSRTFWVRITGARVFGAGARGVIQMEVADDLQGTLYVVGTPRYDASTETLSFDGVDYSFETKRLLHKFADWLLHHRLQDKIAAKARWPLTRPVGVAKQQVESALNRRYGVGQVLVWLRGRLSDARPLAIQADGDGFSVRAGADGSVSALLLYPLSRPHLPGSLPHSMPMSPRR
jgi:hypothetical protein